MHDPRLAAFLLVVFTLGCGLDLAALVSRANSAEQRAEQDEASLAALCKTAALAASTPEAVAHVAAACGQALDDYDAVRKDMIALASSLESGSGDTAALVAKLEEDEVKLAHDMQNIGS